MSRWYKLEGDTPVPCGLIEAAETRDDRWRLQEQVGDLLISTVFLALDHRHFDNGPPILFETMVFVDGDAGRDIHCERYCTKAEAELGHWKTVGLAQAGLLRSGMPEGER